MKYLNFVSNLYNEYKKTGIKHDQLNLIELKTIQEILIIFYIKKGEYKQALAKCNELLDDKIYSDVILNAFIYCSHQLQNFDDGLIKFENYVQELNIELSESVLEYLILLKKLNEPLSEKDTQEENMAASQPASTVDAGIVQHDAKEGISKNNRQQKAVYQSASALNKKRWIQEKLTEKFLPSVPRAIDNQSAKDESVNKKKLTSYTRLSAPFLGKNSRFFCAIDESSKSIEDFKISYPKPYELLVKKIEAGLIVPYSNAQGIKYLAEPVHFKRIPYHWEAKILSNEGGGNFRLFAASKKLEGYPGTTMVFDIGASHEEVEIARKNN